MVYHLKNRLFGGFLVYFKLMNKYIIYIFVFGALLLTPGVFVVAQDGSVPPESSDPAVDPGSTPAPIEPTPAESVVAEPAANPTTQPAVPAASTSVSPRPTSGSVPSIAPPTTTTAPATTIEPVVQLEVENNSASTKPTNPVAYFLALGVAALVVVLGVLGVAHSNNKKKSKQTDRCQPIKDQLEQKKIELKAATQELSLQKILLDSLKKKVDDTAGKLKDAAKKKIIKTVKQQVKLADDSLLGRGVAAVESGVELYENAQEKLDQAKKMLTLLQTKQTKLTQKVKELEAAYTACLAGGSVQPVNEEAGLVIPLPSRSKKTIFIFHGTGGNPKENWFPWLKDKIEASGNKVIIPQFPTPEGQSLEAWLNVLSHYKASIDEDTIFIAHSLGGIFLLRVLEQLSLQATAAFFVSAPIGARPIKNYDSDNAFSGFVFDWKKILTKARHFFVYHSDDDPYVSLGNGKILAKNLKVDLTFISHAGHFNTKAGYTKFEKLWEDLQSILNL